MIIPAIIFNLYRIEHVGEMIQSREPTFFEVFDLSCRYGRKTSSITIITPLGNRSFKYKKEKCFETEIGAKVPLYHSTDYSKFYIPEAVSYYNRYIYFFVVVLVVVITPWGRLLRRLSS